MGQNWEAEVELGRAMIFEARGQFRDAEASYRLGEQRKRAGVKGVMESENPPAETIVLQAIDYTVLSQARMKARQGRFAEAEADARRALLSRLKDQGKYNPSTPRFVMGLADILVEEGRYAEAEQLARVCLEINRTVGVADDSQSTVQLLSQLGGILNLQRKGREAIAVYAQIDKAIAGWEPARRQVFELNGSRIASLYVSGQVDAGIAAAEQLVKKQVAKVGENHFDTASARGTLAIGLMRAGRDAEAIGEFKAAIPVLMAVSRENADDENTTVVAARSQRLQGIVESYFTMLARGQNPDSGVGIETFSLADAVRGRAVQQALAASSARATAKDPALAELVRREQDLGKQVNAQLGMLNNVLALSSAERDEKGVQAINASINSLRAERNKARLEIGQKFPAYADLVSPKPPTVDQIKATLVEGEALLSFYFGQGGSFVWAVPKNGPVAFAAINATSGDIESKVRKLREALEPQAAMISDIPAFDLKLAYELYSLLLKPVESGLEPGEKPDRDYQRRAGPAAAVAVADRAQRSQSWTTTRCFPATAMCRGWRAPTRSPRCRPRRRCGLCGNLPAGQAEPRGADWRSAIRISAGNNRPTQKRPMHRCRWRTPAAAMLHAACRSSGAAARSSRVWTAPNWRCCRGFPTPPPN